MDRLSHHHGRPRRPADPAAAVGCAILIGHGLIHLMGVALLWRLGRPGDLRSADLRPSAESPWAAAVGAGWLVAVLLFVVAAALLLLHHRGWRPVAAVAALVSLAVLAPSASVAAAGLAVDGAVLLAVLAASRPARTTRAPR